jgi:hypothetical protein
LRPVVVAISTFGMSDPSLTFGTSHQREPLAATEARLHRA